VQLVEGSASQVGGLDLVAKRVLLRMAGVEIYDGFLDLLEILEGPVSGKIHRAQREEGARDGGREIVEEGESIEVGEEGGWMV